MHQDHSMEQRAYVLIICFLLMILVSLLTYNMYIDGGSVNTAKIFERDENQIVNNVNVHNEEGESGEITSHGNANNGNGERVEKCIKVVTYNVLETPVIKVPQKVAQLANYFNHYNFDVIALQELNHWSENILAEAAKMWGHNYTIYLPTPFGYDMGISSKIPFEVIRLRTQGFHHGMIHIKLLDSSILPILSTDNEYTSTEFNDAGDDDDEIANPIESIKPENEQFLHIIVSHLDPHNATKRFEESHHIDRQSREHPWLIAVGDMNALSSYDSEYYNSINLFATLNSTPQLATKFLYQVNESKAIDYRVMDKYYNEGKMKDCVALFEDQFAAFPNTVPSKMNEDSYHAAPMRIDYILATENISAGCTEAFVDKTDETETISDHFPVIATFCF